MDPDYAMPSQTARTTPPSLRIYPDNWLTPTDFRTFFPHPDRPLDIDIGAGKGRFLLARAARHPHRNLLGIERMLKRVRKMDARAGRAGLENLRLLRIDAYYAVTQLLPSDCASTIFILFPDPWPKKKHHHHRFMGPAFLDALHRVLIAGGSLHFATDHLPYFHAVMELLDADARFTPQPTWRPEPDEQTDFERLYLPHKPIGRASFSVDA